MIPKTIPTPGHERAVQPLIEVEQLRIDQRDGHRKTIVSSVSLAVASGETIGIVGESGSGKSMTARAITGLLPPTFHARGSVSYRGRNLLTLREREWRAIRGREIGLILQDPFTMLNPLMRCGRIVEESLAKQRHRGNRSGRSSEAIRRLSEVGIADESVVSRYPFQLSGGMRQRVAIAAALARDPHVLIADEPSTALDVTTQREILTLLKTIQGERGMALILITHDLRVAFGMCDRIYVLYAGGLVEVAPADELEAEPLHPYSQGLLLSEPSLQRRMRELVTIPGAVPAPDDVTSCCSFAPRCRWAESRCRAQTPPLVELSAGRLSACIRVREIQGEMKELRLRVLDTDTPSTPAQTTTPVIVVRGIGKSFRNGTRTVTALDDVSIEVGEGESVGVVGESGSGKTTLARILVGLETASSGEILIGDTTTTNWANLTRTEKRTVRGIVQIVFQDPYSSLNPMRSIGWTLREAVLTHNASAHNVDAQVEELLESVSLPLSYAERKPAALSGGERQRIAIARALAVKPRMLICDEPVSALDVSVQAQILNLIRSLKDELGLSYLFITHDLSIVRQMCDRLYVMSGGRIVEAGSTEQVLDHPCDPYTVQLLDSVPRSDADWLTR